MLMFPLLLSSYGLMMQYLSQAKGTQLHLMEKQQSSRDNQQRSKSSRSPNLVQPFYAWIIMSYFFDGTLSGSSYFEILSEWLQTQVESRIAYNVMNEWFSSKKTKQHHIFQLLRETGWMQVPGLYRLESAIVLSGHRVRLNLPHWISLRNVERFGAKQKTSNNRRNDRRNY